jgi:hypothetical protein
MDDGSSNENKSAVSRLKNEWALFWESIAGDEAEDEASLQAKADDAFHTGKLEILSVEQIHEISKKLSQDRKRLHQKLETLNKELDLNAAKLETLRLVGGSEEETLKRINELNDIGQILGNQLSKLDEKIKWARGKQKQFLAEALGG